MSEYVLYEGELYHRSGGNPYHDKRGRFTNAPGGAREIIKEAKANGFVVSS